MRLETTLVFHEFTTRPVEEARLWTFFSPPHWLSWSRLYEVDNDTFLPSAEMSGLVSDMKANANLV